LTSVGQQLHSTIDNLQREAEAVGKQSSEREQILVDRMAEIESREQQTKAQLESEKEQIERASEEIRKKLQTTIGILRQESESAVNKAIENERNLSAKIEQLTADYEAASNTVNELQASIATLRHESEIAVNEARERELMLREKISLLENGDHQMKAELKQVENEKTEMQSVIKRLSEENVVLTQNSNTLQLQLDCANQITVDLEGDITRMRAELDTLSKTNNTLETQLLAAAAEFCNERKTLESRSEELRTDLERTLLKLEHLAANSNQSSAEAAEKETQLLQEINKASRVNLSLEQRVELLESERNAAVARLEEVELANSNDKKAWNDQLTELQSELAASKSAFATLSANATQMSTEAVEREACLAEELSSVVNAKQALEELHNAAENKVVDLAAQLEAAHQTIREEQAKFVMCQNEAESDKLKTVAQLETLHSEMERIQCLHTADIGELETKIQAAEQKLSLAEIALQNVEVEKMLLQREAELQREKIAALTEQLTSAGLSAAAALEDAKSSTLREVTEISQELEQNKQRLAAFQAEFAAENQHLKDEIKVQAAELAVAKSTLTSNIARLIEACGSSIQAVNDDSETDSVEAVCVCIRALTQETTELKQQQAETMAYVESIKEEFGRQSLALEGRIQEVRDLELQLTVLEQESGDSERQWLEREQRLRCDFEERERQLRASEDVLRATMKQLEGELMAEHAARNLKEMCRIDEDVQCDIAATELAEEQQLRKHWQAECEEMQSRLGRLESKLADAKLELVASEQLIAKGDERLSNLRSERQMMEEQISVANERANVMKQMLSAESEAKRRMEVELRAQMKDMHDNFAIREQLLQRQSETEQLLVEKDALIDEGKQRTESVEKELANMQALLAEKQAAIEQQTAEAEKWKSKLQEAQQKRLEAEAELKDTNIEKNSIDADLQTTLDQLQATLNQLAKERGELALALQLKDLAEEGRNQAERGVQELGHKLFQVENELEATSNELKMAMDELETHKRSEATLALRLREAEQSRAQFRDRLAQKQAENERMRVEVGQMREEVNELVRDQDRKVRQAATESVLFRRESAVAPSTMVGKSAVGGDDNAWVFMKPQLDSRLGGRVKKAAQVSEHEIYINQLPIIRL
jgi:chromosome segregation ATPase